MQGLIQSGNYGFEIPLEILDHSWRKYLQQQHQNLEVILSGLTNIRSFLSQEDQPNNMIEIVFHSQIHKVIMKYCKRVFRRLTYNNLNWNIDLQIFHQILWIFTNLACGDYMYSKQLVTIGVLELSIDILTLPQLPQIAKIFSIDFELISNIAGQYNAKTKVSYLTNPTFQHFLNTRYLNYINYNNFHELGSIALYSMFRDIGKCANKSSAYMQSVKHAFSQFYGSFIKNVLILVQPQAGNNIQALFHLLLIYFELTKDQADYNSQTKCIVQNYLNHPDQKIRNTCIKIYGNMVANSDLGVDYALQNCLFINLLIHSLKNTNQAKLQKQCAWILSNILAGTSEQIDYFIQYNPTIFNDIYQVLNEDLDDNVIKQMSWSISNLYSTCSQKTFQTVYESSIVQQISNLVQKCQLQIVKQVYVQGIQNYLKKLISSQLKTNIFVQNSFFIIKCLNFIISNGDSQKATNKSLQLLQKINSLLKNCQNANILSNQGLEQNLLNLQI